MQGVLEAGQAIALLSLASITIGVALMGVAASMGLVALLIHLTLTRRSRRHLEK